MGAIGFTVLRKRWLVSLAWKNPQKKRANRVVLFSVWWLLVSSTEEAISGNERTNERSGDSNAFNDTANTNSCRGGHMVTEEED